MLVHHKLAVDLFVDSLHSEISDRGSMVNREACLTQTERPDRNL